MAGPWEAYQPQAQRGPWEAYQAAVAPATTEAMPVTYEGTTPAAPPRRMSELLGGAEAKIQAPGGFWRTLGEGLLQGGPPSQETAPPVAERFQSLLRAVTSPFEAISRGVAGPVSETGIVSPRSAETIGEGVAAVAGMIPPGRTVQAIRRLGVRPPARTVQDILPVRPGLPPPEPQLALPAPARAALPEPANMVMEAGPEGITRVPPRNIVDLVDEIKKDVKTQVIDDIFEELRTGATAAMPRRQPPAALPAPRRMQAEQAAATGELMQDFAPKAPAIELPPPQRPKIIMGKSGYRGEATETKPIVPPQRTLDELISAANAKADKKIEKLGIGQRKHTAKVIPEEPPIEPPFEIPGEVQPWQMTPGEYRSQQVKGQPEYIVRNQRNLAMDFDRHKELVQEAITEGKPVPPKVLAAYPEIQKETPQVAQGRTIEAQAIPEAGQPPTPKRTPLDILKEETGTLKLPRREDPMAALRPEHEMGSAELARKSFTTRTSKIFEQMGPTGKKMGEDLADAYYAGNQRRAKLDVEIDKIFDKYPGVEDTLLARIHGGGGKGTQAEAAAFREIKALSDIPGDEAIALKVKVKNPITGVEREFKKQRIYAPSLIDPAKVAKNPTRLVDSIMEELISDGMEGGKARTQAIEMVRNMSKKSGSLQYARTGKFDPDIHMTNAREAYKRALGGEVERLEVLKRFGKTDKAGLLSDEIGGIRERTANISAEAGPEAAQKAELWATRQLGMPRGEIDTIQKKAGELSRNYNILKLGFMPVTNLAAQMPMILAAGRTTRFNPVKSFQMIQQSFGKSGEGARLGKLFGVAVENTADDFLRKFDMARGGPGGKTATAFLHYTGGLKSENFVAKLAANVGNEEAKYLIQKLINNPNSKSAAKAISKYGLDPAKVLREGATEHNIFRIGRKFADEVLLRGNVLDLPPAFTSESGKVFFQFKRATQMLGQQMYDAAKNDPGKLIALLAASQIGGEAMLDIKAGVRGIVAAIATGDVRKIAEELNRRPKDARRALDNWAAALSFGYLGDTVMDVASGVEPKNIISGATVAASPFESALHVTQGAGKIARGEKGGGKQILGGVLQQAPGGTFFRGLTRPEKSERQKLLEDLGLSKIVKENRAAQKEIKEQLGLD